MHTILHQIFNNSRFMNDIETRLELYHKDHAEYYIIEKYTPEEINDFFNCEKTTKIIKEFQAREEKNIEKNTSLIIIVKVQDLKEFYKKNINQIMKIEEDEYYFRKYIILYDEKGEKELQHKSKNDFSNNDIFNILNENGMFEAFEKDMFFNSSFFICMELAIKLPFIIIPQSEEKYKTLEQILKERIKALKLERKEARVLEVLKIFNENETTPEIKKMLETEITPQYETLRQLYEEI